MKPKNLWILIGIPGSGKTTWLKKQAKENAKIVSRDAIRFEMLAESDAYFAKEKEVYRKYINEIQDGLYDKTISQVYADATHLNPASRRKLLKELDLTDVGITFVCFDVSLKTALLRNSKREGRARVPDDVIRNMQNSLQFTTDEEAKQYNVLTYVIDAKGDYRYATNVGYERFALWS